MLSNAIAEVQRRLPAIPWDAPIRVHFSCDDEPLYGCRLCILRFGLKAGDRSRLFADEAEALSHIGTHADAASDKPYSEYSAGYPNAPEHYDLAGRMRRGP
jgi:hypothetical protein